MPDYKDPTKEQIEYVQKLFKDNNESLKDQVKEGYSGSRFFTTLLDSDLGLVEFKYIKQTKRCDSISFYIYDLDKEMKYKQTISPYPSTGILSSPGELI